MPEGTTQAESAIKNLLKADEDQLYEQLGMRVKAITEDPSKAGSFDPHVIYSEAEMGLKDDIRDMGRRIFRRWNAEAHRLICGSEAEETGDREKLTKALGISDAAAAAALSGVLITVGIAPAIAAVVAALVIKRFGRPVYEEFCKAWGKHVV